MHCTPENKQQIGFEEAFWETKSMVLNSTLVLLVCNGGFDVTDLIVSSLLVRTL